MMNNEEQQKVDKKVAKAIGLECYRIIRVEERKHSSRSEIIKKLIKTLKEGVDNAN